MSGSVAMLCFAATVWQQRNAREHLNFALLPLVLAVTTMLLRGKWPSLHSTLAVAAAGVALHNGWRFSGAPRWFSLAGAVAWVIALACARRLFGS